MFMFNQSMGAGGDGGGGGGLEDRRRVPTAGLYISMCQ